MVLPSFSNNKTTPRPPMTTTTAASRGLYSASSSKPSAAIAVTPASTSSTMRRASMTDAAASTTTQNDSTADDDDDSSSSFFLCWGSSIHVNEDLRRSIRSEVEDISASMDETQHQLGGAQHTCRQLDKDLRLAYTEMSNLERSMQDNTQVSQVNEQLQWRLEQVLDESILTTTPQDNNENDENNVQHMRTRKNQILKRIQTLVAECEESKRQVHAMETQEIAVLEQRIQQEGLPELLVSLQKQQQEQQEEKTRVEQEHFATSQALQASRMRCSEYQEQIDRNTTLLNTQTAEHEQVMSAKSKTLETKKHEAEQAQQELDALEKNRDTFAAQLVGLEQQLLLAESMRITTASVKTRHDKLLDDNQELETELAKLQQDCEVAQTKLDDTVLPALAHAREQEAQVQKVKLENDATQAQQETEGQAELERLVQEKQELTKAIADLMEEQANQDHATQLELAKTEEELKTLHDEWTRDQEQLQTVLKERNMLDEQQLTKQQKEHAELQEATQLLQSLQQDIQDKKTVVKKLKTQVDKQQEFEAARAELDALYQVYLVGKELWETTLETVNHLVHEPLVLLDNDEEEATLDETKE